MTPNELLLWLSARKEGSWRQFRSAIERLDLTGEAANEGASLPLHLRIYLNLERLAHVEFSSAENQKDWRIVRPCSRSAMSFTRAGCISATRSRK